MIIMDERTSRSLEEMAAQSNGGRGWECPRCGCRHWRVVKTRQLVQSRKRWRECRHCRYQMITFETPGG